MYSNFKDLGMKGLLSDESDDNSDCERPQNCKYGPNQLEVGMKMMFWKKKIE